MTIIIILCVILFLAGMGAIGLWLFWKWKSKRLTEKTYLYHIKITLNNGKIITLTLDETRYITFNQLLNQETGKFQIAEPNKIDNTLQDSATTLFVQYVAAVNVKRW